MQNWQNECEKRKKSTAITDKEKESEQSNENKYRKKLYKQLKYLLLLLSLCVFLEYFHQLKVTQKSNQIASEAIAERKDSVHGE